MSPVALPVGIAAVLHGANDLRVEQRTAFPPRAGEAQVAVLSTGICGSDLHYYQHGRNGDFAIREPLVLGHEAAGIVTAVGEGVSHLRVGQAVAIEAGVMCRACSNCLGGRYNLCSRLRFASSAKTFPHLDGTLQSRMNHPAHVLHPLPENCTIERAALAEPLSVVFHAMRRASLQPGQTVLVLGAGSIGILACSLAKALGASRVAAIDINRARLDWAITHGVADAVFHVPLPPRPADFVAVKSKNSSADEGIRRSKENAVDAMRKFGMEDGFDIVLECTGVETSAQTGIFCARTGGKLMLVGMGTPIMNLPISAAALREVDILGTFRYANTYPSALAMLGSGALRGIDHLVTHRFSLENTADAFELISRGVDREGNLVLKVVVEPPAGAL
ncbi:GroES-like protein [Ramaria rubella]|nr:GroES-like protein [Ramaria rubella]